MDKRLVGTGVLVVAGILLIFGAYGLLGVAEKHSRYIDCISNPERDEPGSFGGPICIEVDWSEAMITTIPFAAGIGIAVFGYSRYFKHFGVQIGPPRSG
jgi:hypothetical protein